MHSVDDYCLVHVLVHSRVAWYFSLCSHIGKMATKRLKFKRPLSFQRHWYSNRQISKISKLIHLDNITASILVSLDSIWEICPLTLKVISEVVCHTFKLCAFNIWLSQCRWIDGNPCARWPRPRRFPLARMLALRFSPNDVCMHDATSSAWQHAPSDSFPTWEMA